MTTKQANILVTRWQQAMPPSSQNIAKLMKAQGLRPYMWTRQGNYRYAVTSHSTDKVLFVIEGSIEVQFPDLNQSLSLRVGDRIDIVAGTRHAINIGHRGAICAEASIRR